MSGSLRGANLGKVTGARAPAPKISFCAAANKAAACRRGFVIWRGGAKPKLVARISAAYATDGICSFCPVQELGTELLKNTRLWSIAREHARKQGVSSLQVPL